MPTRTRDPNTPGFVAAKELPDVATPPANLDGNFVIGPTHDAAPGMAEAPKGTVIEFTMSSSKSKIYPGIACPEGMLSSSKQKFCHWLRAWLT
jgi:iron(III)-enterobactin esterase